MTVGGTNRVTPGGIINPMTVGGRVTQGGIINPMMTKLTKASPGGERSTNSLRQRNGASANPGASGGGGGTGANANAKANGSGSGANGGGARIGVSSVIGNDVNNNDNDNGCAELCGKFGLTEEEYQGSE